MTRTGWHTVKGKRCFVLPTCALGDPDGEAVILEGSAGPFAARGDLSDWKAGVGRLVSGHSRGALMVAASLSAPLLALAGLDGGGVHLVGSSSCGKSTLLEAAASCWGRGFLMDLCGRGARRQTRSKARLLITMMSRCLSMSLALSIRATRPRRSTSWRGGKEKAGRERMDRYGSHKRGA